MLSPHGKIIILVLVNGISMLYHKFKSFFLFEYNSENDIRIKKATGLLLLGALGLIATVVFAVISHKIYDRYCIPGLLVSLITSMLIIRNVIINKLEVVENVIFLIPVAIYFFFISNAYSLYPNVHSYYSTVWGLGLGFLFLILFSTSFKRFLFYAAVSIGTILTHMLLTSNINLLFDFKWITFENRINPVLSLILLISLTSLILLAHKRRLSYYEQSLEDINHRINSVFRKYKQPALVVEEINDEHGEVTGLKIVRVNPAFEKTFRISNRKIANHNLEQVFPSLFRNNFNWSQFFLGKEEYSSEIYFDKYEKWFEIEKIQHPNNQSICIFSDKTQNKQEFYELQASESRYKALLQAIPDIFFVIDKDGIYMDYVAKEQDLLKVKPDDIIGNSIFEVGFSDKMTRAIFQGIQNVIRFDSIETIEYAFDTPHGTMLFEMRMVKLDDQSVISLARDITKRKLTEQKLEEAKNKAEEADKLKSAFLANLSHEVRTPMNAILGFSKMLASPDFEEEERLKFINIITHNGEILMKLLTDMINLSKIETGQIEVEKGYLKINQLLAELYRNFTFEKNQNDKGHLKLTLQMGNENPNFAVYTDSTLLRDIMSNLIDNAIKFTDKGEVEFGYSLKSDNKIEFFVKDTGIGIPEEAKEEIFMRFHQLENDKSKNYGGTGLGLSIAQYYAEQIGSSLDFTSVAGKGSRFFFSFKIEKADGHLKVV
ncbi:PAS domain-containing sensor histidine kinase [Puteibacter caeruleilacunae]|nr:PAS domain-containing sensor histidine kinase [Puteibacter caeruleilacunae]